MIFALIPGRDLPALSAMFARAGLCFTDLKTAIRRTAAGAAPVRAGRRGGDQRRSLARIRGALLQEIQDINAGNPALAMIALPPS